MTTDESTRVALGAGNQVLRLKWTVVGLLVVGVSGLAIRLCAAAIPGTESTKFWFGYASGQALMITLVPAIVAACTRFRRPWAVLMVWAPIVAFYLMGAISLDEIRTGQLGAVTATPATLPEATTPMPVAPKWEGLVPGATPAARKSEGPVPGATPAAPKWKDLVPGVTSTAPKWKDLVPGVTSTAPKWEDLAPGVTPTAPKWEDLVPGVTPAARPPEEHNADGSARYTPSATGEVGDTTEDWNADVAAFMREHPAMLYGSNARILQEKLYQVAKPGMTNREMLRQAYYVTTADNRWSQTP